MVRKSRPLHPCARTTRAMRKRIQRSEESDRALAAKFGVNAKTIAKWRKRDSTDDAPMGPRRVRSNSLGPAEEALMVVVRKIARVSLDQQLGALRRFLPGLSRSTLYRCLGKWEVARIPRRLRVAKPSPAKPVAAQTATPPGARLRIFLHQYFEPDGQRAYLWTCLNETADWLYAFASHELGGGDACRFFTDILNQANFPVGSIVTPPNMVFCDPEAPEATWHRFRAVCRRSGVVPLIDVSLPAEPAQVVAGWK